MSWKLAPAIAAMLGTVVGGAYAVRPGRAPIGAGLAARKRGSWSPSSSRSRSRSSSTGLRSCCTGRTFTLRPQYGAASRSASAADYTSIAPGCWSWLRGGRRDHARARPAQDTAGQGDRGVWRELLRRPDRRHRQPKIPPAAVHPLRSARLRCSGSSSRRSPATRTSRARRSASPDSSPLPTPDSRTPARRSSPASASASSRRCSRATCPPSTADTILYALLAAAVLIRPSAMGLDVVPE